MKALIVDDEFKAAEILGLLIEHHVPRFSEVRTALGGLEANEVLKLYQPDIVFLDIKMPGMNGFEWLKQLEQRRFEVIFTTAYDQYAIQAIRYSAFDYLLKPVDPEDLAMAVDRFVAQSSSLHGRFDSLFYNMSQAQTEDFRLTIATTDGTYYLDPTEIIRCEGDGNYTHFHMQTGLRIMASRPLGYYHSMLPEAQFIRCHKSHLVNRKFVHGISDKKVQLTNGIEVEVSRRRMALVKDVMSR